MNNHKIVFFLVFCYFSWDFPIFLFGIRPAALYFKTLNNRPWGANNESLGGPGGPGTGFCSPGGGFFSLSRHSG